MGPQRGPDPDLQLDANPRSARRTSPIRSSPARPTIEPGSSLFERLKLWGAVVLVVGLVIGAAGWVLVPWLKKKASPHGRAAAALEPHVQAFAQAERPVARVEGAYLAGRVLVIDDVNRTVDPVFFELPDDLYAKDPNDVGTVVFVACGNRVLGEYRAKGAQAGAFKAFAINCRVDVIDRAGPTRMGTNVESKDQPPVSQGSLDGNWYAQRPTRDIAAWLVSLPRR